SNSNKDVVIIDDGFHCHHISKTLNIIVIDMANPFDNGLLLPAGLLREPLWELKRADVFILSHPYMVDRPTYQKLTGYLKKFQKPVFIMDYKIECLKDKEKELATDFIKDKDILAFTGTGSPFNFFSLLATLSPKKIYGAVYPDHFHYQKEDIEELEDMCIKKNASCLITTEKDYIKTTMYECSIPMYYLKIRPVLKSTEGKEFDTLLTNVVK
ncbi:MAG: tetraacyldisaccharide 4'-kinase, partial [Candidatus Ratteibacteria bacterium]|nr:tetraacyldisaccharide 4'-kinase [Candidatus Ratteibacteria bacterium]